MAAVSVPNFDSVGKYKDCLTNIELINPARKSRGGLAPEILILNLAESTNSTNYAETMVSKRDC